MNKCTWLFGVSVGLALVLMGCTESVRDESGGGSGGGGPESCDDTTPCEEGYYCDFADDLCGAGEPKGECREIVSTECEQAITVCTCNGLVETCRGAEEVDLTPATNCEAPTGTFACDSFFCDLSTEYCAQELQENCSYLGGCYSPPSECADEPTCECLAKALGVSFCRGEPATGVSATMPGGHGPGCP